LIAGSVALALYSVTDFRHLNYDLRAFWWLSAAAVLSIGSRPISNVGQARPPPAERQA